MSSLWSIPSTQRPITCHGLNSVLTAATIYPFVKGLTSEKLLLTNYSYLSSAIFIILLIFRWYEFNDTKVNEVSKSCITNQGSTVYLLFYKRTDVNYVSIFVLLYLLLY